MTIYSKDGNSKIDLPTKFFCSAAPSHCLDIRVTKLINAVNLYIENNHSINELKQIIISKGKKIGISNIVICKTINALEFTFFENSALVSAAGKDNKFWNELEIRSLPSNIYLYDLIVSILEGRYGDDLKIRSDYLLIKYDHTSGYTPTSPRKQISFDKELHLKITDILKIGIATKYNEEECLFGYMKDPKLSKYIIYPGNTIED